MQELAADSGALSVSRGRLHDERQFISVVAVQSEDGLARLFKSLACSNSRLPSHSLISEYAVHAVKVMLRLIHVSQLLNRHAPGRDDALEYGLVSSQLIFLLA